MERSLEMKSKHTRSALAALLLLVTLSATVSAESPGTESFTMTVLLDSAQGKAVTRGQYEQAIERITSRKSRFGSKFVDHVNLCVAYTKTHETDEADKACDAAIAMATKRSDRRLSKRESDRSLEARAIKFELALALSNRGVLLAATGEADRAEQDFLAAKELQTALEPIIDNNLERLSKMTSS